MKGTEALPVSFPQQVLETIRRHSMLRGGETVLVGVSGGPDSVCLLHSLLSLAPSLSLRIEALHVHHGLRPEADVEAEFVADLARAWGIRLALERVHPSGSRGLGPEASARQLRYAALRQWAARFGASRVALGHTADDQAETVLMRLLQGAGPRGLGGIPPVRGLFIRPLIELPRSAILVELNRCGCRWIEDPSNCDPRFLRNRIRHDLLPLLAGSYNPRIVEALCRVGALSRGVLADLEGMARRELDRLATQEGEGVTLPLDALRALPPGIAVGLLRLALSRLGEEAPLRGWVQRALSGVVEREGSRGRLVVGRVGVERDSIRIRLIRRAREAFPGRSLSIPGSADVPEAGLSLTAREFLRPEAYTAPTGLWTAVFDAEGLPASLTIRSRCPGDRFRPFAAPGSKRLKEFLIDRKVPRWKRDSLPLVVAGDEILWVVGVRRGAAAPVTPATRRVVELHAVPVESF